MLLAVVVPARKVDDAPYRGAYGQPGGFKFHGGGGDHVHDIVAGFEYRLDGQSGDGTRIARLSSAFRVERRPVQTNAEIAARLRLYPDD
ncbi:MAG: hypothetical protein CVV51_12160 [Spirochaetae bacterium HGW-Spirochaetae-7]|nr:MAG: hypothetical protein CVV51_12160 [Spirochaetae bacterium HGW-Spirochaetae-7]